jgi:hypothetical protein
VRHPKNFGARDLGFAYFQDLDSIVDWRSGQVVVPVRPFS